MNEQANTVEAIEVEPVRAIPAVMARIKLELNSFGVLQAALGVKISPISSKAEFDTGDKPAYPAQISTHADDLEQIAYRLSEYNRYMHHLLDNLEI